MLLIASLCLIVGCVRIWGKKALILAFTLTLFAAATFLRQYLYHVLSPVICEYLFYGAVAFTPIAALGVAALRTESVKHEYSYIAFAFWLLLWLGLARDALRYDFFIGVPLACFAAIGVRFFTTHISQHIAEIRKKKRIEEIAVQPSTKEEGKDGKKHHATQLPIFTLQGWVKVGITFVCIALILFWEPPGNKPASRSCSKRIHNTDST